MDVRLPDDIVLPDGGRIILVVMDGLGGLPRDGTGWTELEAARTPNLDQMARRSALGLHVPVDFGIAPGSGPGHLAHQTARRLLPQRLAVVLAAATVRLPPCRGFSSPPPKAQFKKESAPTAIKLPQGPIDL